LLQIAEVMMVMGPLMEFSQRNPELRPQEAMHRMVTETAQNMRMNQMAANANGGMQMNTGQRTPGLNGPNQFASPAMNHLGLPQQGSPHISGPAHTPSPAHLQQGGIAMVHQMSQGNSNLSGSQGPSTNTRPNVTTKRRRTSLVKIEDENANQEVNGANKVRPSPRIGGKRQKGTA
jgi:transcription elongation factor